MVIDEKIYIYKIKMESILQSNDLELLTAIYSDKEQMTSIAKQLVKHPDILKKRIRLLKITKKFGDNHLKILKLYDEMQEKHEDEMIKYCDDLQNKLCIKLMSLYEGSENFYLLELCETLSKIHMEEVLEFHYGVYKSLN